MRKLALTITATTAILVTGALAWQAQAQTSRAAAVLAPAVQNFTPVEKAQPAACRGGGGVTVRRAAFGRAVRAAACADGANSRLITET
jgi:hypothetical protein